MALSRVKQRMGLPAQGLIGASHSRQIESNLQALNSPEFSEQEIQAILDIVQNENEDRG